MKSHMTWALLLAALALTGPARADDKPVKKGEEPVKKGKAPFKKGKAPTMIVLDASKLPPEMVAQLLKLAAETRKPAPAEGGTKKVVKGQGAPDQPAKKVPPQGGDWPGAHSMGQAVGQVEKSGKGTVVKAEQVGEVFVLDVVWGDGTKETVKVPSLKKTAGEGGTKKAQPPTKKVPGPDAK